MAGIIKPHGRIMREVYLVKEVEQIKCWTKLKLEGSPSLFLRRMNTNQNLIDRVIGNKIIVKRIEHPPMPSSYILDVFYQGNRIYPYHQELK